MANYLSESKLSVLANRIESVFAKKPSITNYILGVTGWESDSATGKYKYSVTIDPSTGITEDSVGGVSLNLDAISAIADRITVSDAVKAANIQMLDTASKDGMWTSVSTLPYDFRFSSAVVYNNEIHLLGGAGDTGTKHYKWNGSTWTSVPTLPYDFYAGSAVVYNNEIHTFYINNNTLYHYRWDGSSWSDTGSVSLSHNEYSICGCTVFDHKICIIAQAYTDVYYYIYNDNGLTYVNQLPIRANSLFVYKNELYTKGTDFHLYKLSGYEWTQQDITIPQHTFAGGVVVYRDVIHLIGGTDDNLHALDIHYKWSGSEWVISQSLPVGYNNATPIVYDEKINILGSDKDRTTHYTYSESMVMNFYADSVPTTNIPIALTIIG